MASLYITPFVLTDMLSVLCNYRLRNPSQCLLSPTDLQTLLFNDDGSCETSRGRYCESVSTLWGGLHEATQSYQESLRQKSFHRIQRATKYRIMLALNQLKERSQIHYLFLNFMFLTHYDLYSFYIFQRSIIIIMAKKYTFYNLKTIVII